MVLRGGVAVTSSRRRWRASMAICDGLLMRWSTVHQLVEAAMEAIQAIVEGCEIQRGRRRDLGIFFFSIE